MTFAFFAGRSTLRRLHQTVQRNLSKRHASHESNTSSKTTKTNSKPSDNAANETFTGSYSAWIDPIKIPFRAYSSMQSRSPYLTQFETSLVIYFLGDVSAQTVQTNVFTTGSYEPIRGIRAMIIGGISSIPSYNWFLWLGRHFNYSSHIKSLCVKITVNQMCFTPIFNTYFFGMQTILAGGGFADAWERVKNTVPRSFVNSWKVWPLITAFNFTFIKPQSRSAVAGCFAVVWQTYLSWLNRAAEEAALKEKDSKLEASGKEFERDAKNAKAAMSGREFEREVEKAVETEAGKVEKAVKRDVRKIKKAVEGKE